MSEKKSGVVGLVLAGGKSRRLGQDKTQLRLWQPSCLTLLQRTVDLLSPFVDRLWVSGRQEEGLEFLPDSVVGCGPIGGVIAGLQAAQNRACCVLACDLPLLSKDIVQRLFLARKHRGKAVVSAFQNPNGRFETTVAIYEQAALPFLQAAVLQNQFSLFQAIPADLWHAMPYTQVEQDCFLNVNMPEDLEKVQALLI